MSNKLLLIFGLALIFHSCIDHKVDKVVQGIWSIDKGCLVYKKVDISNCMNSNIIVIGESCRFPKTRKNFCTDIINANDDAGTYELISQDNGYRIIFDTKNELFSDQEFDVLFDKDEEEGLLKMILVSNSLWIRCTKGLFDYDANKEFVEELIRVTQQLPPDS
jgi:hypothetical protein